MARGATATRQHYGAVSAAWRAVFNLSDRKRVSEATAAKTAAERQRAYRERRRDGFRCAMVDVRDSDIVNLVAGGWLPERVAGDMVSVGHALGHMLDALPLASWPRNMPPNRGAP